MNKNQNFEDASKELEKIINQLENNNLTLSESVEKFKKAEELLKICDENFKLAKGKITIIKDNIEKDFDED